MSNCKINSNYWKIDIEIVIDNQVEEIYIIPYDEIKYMAIKKDELSLEYNVLVYFYDTDHVSIPKIPLDDARKIVDTLNSRYFI